MITFGSIGQLVINSYFLSKNRTQLEIMEDFNNNIFDTGDIFTNAKEVLGDPDNKIWWLIPVEAGQKTTDGHNYYFHYFG